MLFRKTKPTYKLPGWKQDRGYDLTVPTDPSGDLVIVIHGFTHDSHTMRALTSPDGVPENPASFDSLARAEGALVCYPNGTSLTLMPGRCWNGGGGSNGYCAVAKKAVDNKIDDIRYFEELIAHLRSQQKVERVYLTGISNGAAMAHRFVTQRPDQVRALAVVAGCNQFAAAEKLIPEQATPILHIHGTADPIWPYDGGQIPTQGRLDSVESSLSIWARANNAALVENKELTHLQYDDQRVTFCRYEGSAALELYRVEGGGHTWPGGQQYLPKKVIGPVHPRFSASSTILEFFKRFR